MFWALEVSSKYWQIEMEEKDVDKPAFVAHPRLYRYTIMPFELKNILVTFQKALDVILNSRKFKSVTVYINYIFIISKSPQQLLKDVNEVLGQL